MPSVQVTLDRILREAPNALRDRVSENIGADNNSAPPAKKKQRTEITVKQELKVGHCSAALLLCCSAALLLCCSAAFCCFLLLTAAHCCSLLLLCCSAAQNVGGGLNGSGLSADDPVEVDELELNDSERYAIEPVEENECVRSPTLALHKSMRKRENIRRAIDRFEGIVKRASSEIANLQVHLQKANDMVCSSALLLSSAALLLLCCSAAALLLCCSAALLLCCSAAHCCSLLFCSQQIVRTKSLSDEHWARVKASSATTHAVQTTPAPAREHASTPRPQLQRTPQTDELEREYRRFEADITTTTTTTTAACAVTAIAAAGASGSIAAAAPAASTPDAATTARVPAPVPQTTAPQTPQTPTAPAPPSPAAQSQVHDYCEPPRRFERWTKANNAVRTGAYGGNAKANGSGTGAYGGNANANGSGTSAYGGNANANGSGTGAYGGNANAHGSASAYGGGSVESLVSALQAVNASVAAAQHPQQSQSMAVTQPQYDQTQPQSQYLSQTQPLPAYASVYPTAYPTAWYPPPPKFTPPPPPPALKNLFPTHSAHSAPIAARYASHTSLSHQHALTPRSKNLALIR